MIAFTSLFWLLKALDVLFLSFAAFHDTAGPSEITRTARDYNVLTQSSSSSYFEIFLVHLMTSNFLDYKLIPTRFQELVLFEHHATVTSDARNTKITQIETNKILKKRIWVKAITFYSVHSFK
jgi:SUMO ligase MMS21 Smc5/6 complex component